MPRKYLKYRINVVDAAIPAALLETARQEFDAQARVKPDLKFYGVCFDNGHPRVIVVHKQIEDTKLTGWCASLVKEKVK